MNPSRPSLAQLRGVVQKARHREIGNWLARRIARPTAVYGTWAAIRLGLSAHQVTVAALLSSVAGAVMVGTGDRFGFVIGVVLLQAGFWLDHVDGQVARWRGSVSLDGVYFDYLMHHVVNLSLGFGLGHGLAVQAGDLRWSLAGCAIALGWGVLNLHNDCRYKAFFQRLKSTSMSFRVEGGSGGRPAPPVPWPRRGRGALTWPAYKACEPHAVLMVLTVLAVLAWLVPSIWPQVLRSYVGGMAVLAPLLATARAARAVNGQGTESEFDRWFRPIEAGET